MAFNEAFDVTFPPDTQQANLLGLDIRNTRLDIQQRMASISGLDANKPNFAGDVQPANWNGMLFFATDTSRVYQFNNPNWTDVTASLSFGITGEMRLFGGTAAPTGWLMCQGQAISRTTYANLFTAIGTAFGAGDGSTTFNLPDLRGRAPIGSGAGSGLTNRALGSTGGEETHLLSASEMPQHNHASPAFTGDNATTVSSSPLGIGEVQLTTGSGAIYIRANSATITLAATTGNAGGASVHNNMQPWQAVNFIIKF